MAIRPFIRHEHVVAASNEAVRQCIVTAMATTTAAGKLCHRQESKTLTEEGKAFSALISYRPVNEDELLVYLGHVLRNFRVVDGVLTPLQAHAILTTVTSAIIRVCFSDLPRSQRT